MTTENSVLKHYMTSAEAAKLLGYSHDHVRKLILKGKIKGTKLGNNWLLEPQELHRFKRKRDGSATNGSERGYK